MALTPAERQRAYRLKNPYKLTTTDIVVDGVKYTIPNNAMKPKAAKGFIKFLNKLEKNPSVENYRNLVAGLSKDVANQIRDYRYYLQGEKKGSFATGSGTAKKEFFEKIKLPKKSTNFLSTLTKKDIAGQIMRTSATPVTADNKLRKSFNKVIDINKEFKKNPRITLEDLTKKIYKSKFTKGDDTVKLRLATTTSDDVAKYLQALNNARKTPKGMSAQWSPPSGNKLKEIMTYIGSQTEGFRFREGTLRKYKFSLRDAALNLAPNTTENLRNRLKGTTGVIDEAVGLSATYKNAPGYTELGQFISKDLNIEKGAKIDKKFSSLLENVINGEIDVEEINKFNKKSQAFAKANKIDTPILNIGGDPTKDIEYFTELSKEAQKNVLDLAEGKKGFSIKSSAAPFGMLADKLDVVRASPELYKKLVNSIEKAPQACRAILNYSTGGISTTCAAAIKADPVKAATALEEIKPTSAALGKVRNAARSFLKFAGKGKGFAIGAGLGVGGGALVKKFTSDDPSTYLTNDAQANAMILDTIDEKERQERMEAIGDAPELLDEARIGGELAVTGAAVPGASAVYQARRKPFTRIVDGVKKTRPAMGPARAALGPVGKALSGFATPAGIAALTPLNVASSLYQGDSAYEVATDPLNYLAPALAGTMGSLSKEATRGMGATSKLAKALRLGMSPGAIKMVSRRFGLPGLALSSGISLFELADEYKSGRGMFGKKE